MATNKPADDDAWDLLHSARSDLVTGGWLEPDSCGELRTIDATLERAQIAIEAERRRGEAERTARQEAEQAATTWAEAATEIGQRLRTAEAARERAEAERDAFREQLGETRDAWGNAVRLAEKALGERDRLAQRERYFAKALSVADGGRYRADWPGAIERCIRERDTARQEAAEQGRRLAALADECDAMRKGRQDPNEWKDGLAEGIAATYHECGRRLRAALAAGQKGESDHG